MGALLKRFFMATAFVLAVAYTASMMAVSRISIIRSLFYYAAASMLNMMGCMYMEADHKLLWKVVNNSQFYRSLLQIAKNDWVRALLLTCASILVPMSIGVDMMRSGGHGKDLIRAKISVNPIARDPMPPFVASFTADWDLFSSKRLFDRLHPDEL